MCDDVRKIRSSCHELVWPLNIFEHLPYFLSFLTLCPIFPCWRWETCSLPSWKASAQINTCTNLMWYEEVHMWGNPVLVSMTTQARSSDRQTLMRYPALPVSTTAAAQNQEYKMDSLCKLLCGCPSVAGFMPRTSTKWTWGVWLHNYLGAWLSDPSWGSAVYLIDTLYYNPVFLMIQGLILLFATTNTYWNFEQ